MHNLAKTLAVMSLLAPAGAYSLGIGNIKVHSGLNQNLDAEIILVTSTYENVSDIKASLAPPAKFDEAGIPWSSFLSKIKLEPMINANGSTVIKVTSNEVLKESFLDFLLEVSWPKGNLYREFTVLLDPPVYQKVSASSSRHYDNIAEEPAALAPPQPSYTPTGRPKHPHRVRRVVRTSHDPNVTHKRDTLWKVAERVKKDGEPTVEQIMMALYEANPHAFYKDNINALLPNKKLKIPSEEAVLKLSQEQALAEFEQQMRDWKNNTVTASRDRTEPEEEDTATDKQLTLTAPTDASVSSDVVTDVADEPAKADEKTNNVKPKEKEPDTNVSDEAGTAKTDANVVGPHQDEKLTELESQVAAMQKNLELKQQQLDALKNNKVTPPVEKPEETGEEPPTAPIPVVELPKLPQSTVVKPKVQPQVTEPELPATDSTSWWFVGIGGGLMSLLGWLWWRKRKFEQQFDGESMFAPSSMIKPEKSSTTKPSGLAKKDEHGQSALAGIVGDNSFLNEFTVSDFEVFDTSHVEIDPISETDVYLAYGRYQQAEELMRQAIKDQPDNDEYKLKLLEIFCVTERKKDFINYTNELAGAGKKDQAEFWGKAVEMGREVWPDLTLSTNDGLFTPEDEIVHENIYANLAPVEIEPTLEVVEENHKDEASFEIDTFDSSFEESVIGATAMDSVASEFFDEASEFAFTDSNHSESLDDEPKNNSSIDFDLDQLAIGALNSSASAIEQRNDNAKVVLDKGVSLSESLSDIEILDFGLDSEDDFDFGGDSYSNSLQLDNLANNGDNRQANGAAEKSSDAILQGYEVSDDFDFDLAATETESTLRYFDNNDVSLDFMDLDEMETKLDLAKAYIDMGDSGAAKEIIAEVIDKGNADQVKVARHLLDSLV